MAETRVTDVIVPSVFTEYTLLPSIYRSRFWLSGLIEQPPMLPSLLAGGGRTFNLPFWNDTAGSSGDIPSETVDTTVNNLTTGQQIALRQFREKAWGANDLSAVLAGSDGVEAAASYVNGYWGQAYDQNAINNLKGVIADNIANDAGDLVNDISAIVGSGSNFSDAGIIDAQALLGENGTVGRNDQPGGDFVALLVHPDVYAYMRKEDLITFVPISDQPRPLPFYMSMAVIVDRNAPLAVDVYDTYIMKSGVMSYGIASNGYIPTELERRVERGFGVDELWTRRAFTMHTYGTAWQGASVAGESPTDAELADAANHDRVVDAELMRIVVLKHKINQS